MKLKFAFIFITAAATAYYFLSWMYVFNAFPDHTSRLERFDELTFGWMKGTWAALILLALNITALVLTSRSGMQRVPKIFTGLWLGFFSLFLIWSLL